MPRVSSPTLTWPGRSWFPGERPPAVVSSRAVERCGDAGDRVISGDALDVADALHGEGHAGTYDLVYLDPPFLSHTDYLHEARLDGPADGRTRRSVAYDDRWGLAGAGAYLDMLGPRLEALARLVSATGTLWVHLDWRAAYLVRVLLDEVMGRDRFINEIVWRRAPNLGRQATSGQFGRTVDTIVVYGGPRAKLVPPTRLEPIDDKATRWDAEGRPFTTAPRGDYTDASIARLDAEGRVYRSPTGRIYIKYFLVKDPEGVWCRERRVDTLWTDVPPLRHASPRERTGFPTQKPRPLLERIVRCATPEGGLVLDAFAGSGTTGEAAHALGRRFVLGDAGAIAITTTRARLLRAGAGFTVERCGAGGEASAPVPEITVSRASPAELALTLIAPREPLAWAIDTDYREDRAFNCAWHSERQLGNAPLPVRRDARVPVNGARLGVRVYDDDGSVGTFVSGVQGVMGTP